MKRNSLVIFFLLTFAITWAMWIPAALTKLDGGASVLGPDNPVGQFGRWAPGIAAIILTAVAAGKQGISALFLISKGLDSLMGKSYEVVSPIDRSVGTELPTCRRLT